MGQHIEVGDGHADVTDQVADEVEGAVRERPWLQSAGRLGWVAKGVVYLLFGATATQIARQEPSDDDASPSGALNRIMEQPGGRVLLAVLAVGLVLYFAWRVLSVAVIRDHDVSAWAHRIGYAFSASFYALLAVTAARTVAAGREQGRDNTVERLSRALMESSAGRMLVLLGGAVTIAVGAYFIVRKAAMRSFVDDLDGIGDHSDGMVDRSIVAAGVAGWFGRGVVTVLVGVFVARAAIQFDPDDARGFDGALRTVAATAWGTALVWVCAIGLMLYGAFCLVSHRYRSLQGA